jgi:hypothetical protein
MADALVERALDLFATVITRKTQTTDFDDESLYEAFYAMIESYAPENNQYLAASADGASRALVPAADPIYFDIKELKEATEGPYSQISEYEHYAGVLENTYDRAALIRTSSEALYDSASGGAEAAYARASMHLESINPYAMGNLKNGENPYAALAIGTRPATMWESNEPVYDHGNADFEDDTYGRATAIDIPAVEEGIYDIGCDEGEYSLASMALGAAASGAEPMYGVANTYASDNDEDDYGLATAPQPRGVYDNSTTLVKEDMYSFPMKSRRASGAGIRDSYLNALAAPNTGAPAAARASRGANRKQQQHAEADHTYSMLFGEADDEAARRRSSSYHEAQGTAY